MTDPLRSTLGIALAGMEAQSARLRVAAENVANSESTGKTPGAEPYTRKVLTFERAFNDEVGAEVVRAGSIVTHRSPYRIEHMPGHPAADGRGLVKHPNVNPMVEVADIREANRSYIANLHVAKKAREIVSMTIELMRGT